MPRLPERPRTRIEEIMRARGLTQTEVAARTGWHASSANRLATGRAELTPHSRRVLARILEVREADFHEPIGTPIRPPRARSRRFPEAGFNARLWAVLALLGVPDLESLLRFLLSGDYADLPPVLAQRLREQLHQTDEDQGS